MNELEHYISLYFGIHRDDLDTISKLFKKTRINKGDYFLKAGGYCDKLSFVTSGIFRVYGIKDDREITQWIGTPGYFITDLAGLVFGQEARWNIQALSDSELFTIYKDDYNRIGTLIPKWHELEKRFIAKCFTAMEDRIFTHISMNAEERYQFLFGQNRELFNQVPQQYIASMLGMTPETLSRIRSKLVE